MYRIRTCPDHSFIAKEFGECTVNGFKCPCRRADVVFVWWRVQMGEGLKEMMQKKEDVISEYNDGNCYWCLGTLPRGWATSKLGNHVGPRPNSPSPQNFMLATWMTASVWYKHEVWSMGFLVSSLFPRSHLLCWRLRIMLKILFTSSGLDARHFFHGFQDDILAIGLCPRNSIDSGLLILSFLKGSSFHVQDMIN